MSNVLITGITGMVGSHLAELLIKKTNWKIIGMCRWNSKFDNIKVILNSKRLELATADLTDTISIYKIIKKYKPKYIFHLAAQTYPKVSFDNPIETYNTNINGTTRLLEACKEYCPKSKIHLCSSSEVYGRVNKKDLPIDENVKFHPASPYAISKVGADLVAQNYALSYGMNIFITRMFTHTGPRRTDFFHESSFAKQIALLEKNNKRINKILVGNLDSLRTYADVRDAVMAYYLLMISKKTKKGDVFNIGGNKSCKVKHTLQYLISISKLDNIKIQLDKKRLRPIDADLQIPNIRKFQKIIKWKRKYLFEDTMNDLLNYWREKVKNEESQYIR